MTHSQNGWTAGRTDLLQWFSVPGTNVTLRLRKAYAGPLLIAFAENYHRSVEPIKDPGCWSYAYRLVRGSTASLSNHASGTAIDLNAPQHPLGATGTHTAAQVARIRFLIGKTEGALRWGGDYSGRKDSMHVELNTTDIAKVLRATNALRALL